MLGTMPLIFKEKLLFCKMKKNIVFIALIIVLANTTNAQVDYRTMTWNGIISNFHINQHWSIQADMHFRSTDQWEQFQTIILRPGVSYKFNKKYSLVAGLGYLNNRTTVGGVADYKPEVQIWQQFWIRNQIGNVHLTNRFSLEDRFIGKFAVDDDHLKTTSTGFAIRFRYLLRAQFPWKKSKEFKQGFYNYAQQEIFLNLLHKNLTNGHNFDQIRPVVGFGYRFSPKIDLESGLQYRFLQSKGTTRTQDAIMATSCFIRL